MAYVYIRGCGAFEVKVIMVQLQFDDHTNYMSFTQCEKVLCCVHTNQCNPPVEGQQHNLAL